jgi:hypothetical protein
MEKPNLHPASRFISDSGSELLQIKIANLSSGYETWVGNKRIRVFPKKSDSLAILS